MADLPSEHEAVLTFKGKPLFSPVPRPPRPPRRARLLQMFGYVGDRLFFLVVLGLILTGLVWVVLGIR